MVGDADVAACDDDDEPETDEEEIQEADELACACDVWSVRGTERTLI